MTARKAFLAFLLLFGAATLSAQFAGGAGTPRDPYLVATAQQLNNARYFLDSSFRQTADIDLGVPPYNSGEGWHPIGIRDMLSGDDVPFTGSYDGCGFNISNLRIIRQGNQVNGLFGSVSDAKLTGINLPGLEISADRQSAGLAVFVVDSEIHRCSMSGSVVVDSYYGAAGLVYSLYDSSLTGCRADVRVDFGAGLVATADNATIEDCQVSGTVLGSGGLVGSTSGTLISRCSSSADVTGTYRTGGLVGFNFYLSVIVQSYATGKVTGTDCVGGLVGENQHNSAIAECYASGEVKGEMRVGGLVGSHHHNWMGLPVQTVVLNSFARGRVVGTGMLVGGLIGDAEQAFMNCYCTGEVVGPDDYAGGMTGFAGPNHWGSAGINSYWDVESSGRHDSDGGLPRLTAELTWPHGSDTYQNWDWQTDWSADTGHFVNAGYPYLRDVAYVVPASDENLAPASSIGIRIYPNPFRETTNLEIKTSAPGRISVRIYNLRGQLVRTLFDGNKSGKELNLTWTGKDGQGKEVAAGIYLLRTEASGESGTQRLMRIK